MWHIAGFKELISIECLRAGLIFFPNTFKYLSVDMVIVTALHRTTAREPRLRANWSSSDRRAVCRHTNRSEC